MKKDRKKWSWIGLAVLLAILPLRAAADDELKASQSTIADPSKGLFYQSTFDTQKTDLSHMDVLLQFAKDSGFNRIYFSLLGQTEEEPSRLPAFRLHSAQEKDLADLSYLTSQLEENKISLSLVLDPFSLSPSHPAYRFVKTAWQTTG